MKDCGDIGGSGQFLITKVVISVAKRFIEIRIACVKDRKRKVERMNGVF